MLYLDAIRVSKWFVACLIGEDGHPIMFTRSPDYPACKVDNALRHYLEGQQVTAFEGARETVWDELGGSEMRGLLLPTFVVAGPRPDDRQARTLTEARWLTHRNAELLRNPAPCLMREDSPEVLIPPPGLFQHGILEELGL